MRGFQLWLNLPAAEKMKPASYRDIAAKSIPVVKLAGGGEARIVAGSFEHDGVATRGPIQGLSTDPYYFDVALPADATFESLLPSGHNVFLYLYEGGATVADASIPSRSAAVLGPGESVVLVAGSDGAKFLLLAGKPLREPVVQYGPFVMNTREQIEQALADYRDGRLTA